MPVSIGAGGCELIFEHATTDDQEIAKRWYALAKSTARNEAVIDTTSSFIR